MEKPEVVGAIAPDSATQGRNSPHVGSNASGSPQAAHVSPSPMRSPSEHEGPSPPGTAQSLVARSVRPRDIGRLRRIGGVIRLDQPESLLLPYSPLRVGLRASLPVIGQQGVFVACLGDTLVGFVHFRAEPPDQRWVLHAVGSATGVYGAEPVWETLIGHGIVAAGLNGVKRLYARLPQGSSLPPVLKALGWSPYAGETVMVAQVAQGVSARRTPRGFRSQEPADTWAIHQLYNTAVPRQVQYAEAFTSHRWEVDAQDRGSAGARRSGWLIEEGYHVIGYARATSRDGSHVLEFVYHPERVEALGDLIDGALARIGTRPTKRVYCVIRHYQQEALTALAERGFTPMIEQALHVKYTTVSVRSPTAEAVPFHVDVMEKLPKRVPSFLHGKPSDESAG